MSWKDYVDDTRFCSKCGFAHTTPICPTFTTFNTTITNSTNPQNPMINTIAWGGFVDSNTINTTFKKDEISKENREKWK